MNILKLAKNLKEFTLEDISMLAEMDVENELKTLLNANKIEFKNGTYKYVDKKPVEFGVFTVQKNNSKKLLFEDAVQDFLENYVAKNCALETHKNYKAIFKMNILPFFRGQKLNSITNQDIEEFYKNCELRNLSSRRIKNTLALLKQLIRYFQNQGAIDRKCIFQVRRLSEKTKFSADRIIFDEERY